jgi:hypothetical protein
MRSPAVPLSTQPNSRRDTDQPRTWREDEEVAMTTLDTLSAQRPDPNEVADAALAMADYDAKAGNHPSALEWLGVAELHRSLEPEYVAKRAAWLTFADGSGGPR